jgi:hypothetical protein
MDCTYLITFDNASPADASQYVNELRDVLLDTTPGITIQRRRVDSHAQDFGTSLVLVLGTPAIVAVATAIGNWLKLRQSASLTVKTADEHILVQNITSKDAARLTQIFLTKK